MHQTRGARAAGDGGVNHRRWGGDPAGRAQSDACALASCNKANAGVLVTCSLLCCQEADMLLLAAGSGALPTASHPARPGRAPVASTA